MSNAIITTNSVDDFFCTLAAESKRDKMVIAKAINSAEPLKDVTDNFVIVGIMTTPGIRTQSETPCTNTYLIREDGTALFSQSDGIARGARTIRAIFTPAEIADGLMVFVREMKLANGRTMKTLDFVLDE